MDDATQKLVDEAREYASTGPVTTEVARDYITRLADALEAALEAAQRPPATGDARPPLSVQNALFDAHAALGNHDPADPCPAVDAIPALIAAVEALYVPAPRTDTTERSRVMDDATQKLVYVAREVVRMPLEHHTAAAADLIEALADALEAERAHMQSLAKWVGVPETTPSLEIACEVSAALEAAQPVTPDRETMIATVAAIVPTKGWTIGEYQATLAVDALLPLLGQPRTDADDWCREEDCEYRHWRSGRMPTHRRGSSCPPRTDTTEPGDE